MSSAEQAVVEAPVVKDVEQLKATLKEEKRVRADSEKPAEPTTTPADADTPGVSAADSECRKRRKVDAEDSAGEILDGPLPISDSIEAKPQEKVDIDSAKLEQVSAGNQPTKSPSKPAAAVSSQDAVPNVIDDAVKPNAGQSTENTNKPEPEPTLDAPAALKDLAASSLSIEAETVPSVPETTTAPVRATEAVLA